MKKAIKYFIKAYQKLVSPFTARSCRYYPTCSHYAFEAIDEHGVGKGMAMSAWRILRCNPFSAGGYDPIVHKKATKPGE